MTRPDDPSAAEVADDLDDPVLLFDGVCNFCNAAVRFVVRFDESGTFRFAPLQSDIGQELLSRFDLPTDDFDSFVLVEGDDYYTRSTAVLRVCRRLDGPWPLFHPLIYLPERLRDPAYTFLAEHRYRLFGKKDECPIPEPEIRERFAERALDTS
ncbi:thiol-disulfide oxidoreductase DCC family protein [Haladaptatus cibarius]|uniref:thiol-disulfide oxidoreductase DCC family protein n=1 Tax=Haladaptatus cibarius TaxID=453847 RepID=UPI000679709F|nr:thiol-disulfide oxidoreductase DCC family protein [Haladaptatus cibarius]